MKWILTVLGFAVATLSCIACAEAKSNHFVFSEDFDKILPTPATLSIPETIAPGGKSFVIMRTLPNKGEDIMSSCYYRFSGNGKMATVNLGNSVKVALFSFPGHLGEPMIAVAECDQDPSRLHVYTQPAPEAVVEPYKSN